MVSTLMSIYIFAFSSVCFSDGINGSGKIISKMVQVSNFSMLDIWGGPNVTIKKGDTESLYIEAEDNILPLIDASVANNTLKIGFKPATFHINKTIKYVITMKSLEGIRATGGSSFIVEGNFISDKMDLEFRGMISASLPNIDVKSLTASLMGKAQATLAGKAPKQDLNLRGECIFDGKALSGKDVSVKVVGGGVAKVNASDTLVAVVYTDSEVEYFGKPKITSNIIGEGKITAGS